MDKFDSVKKEVQDLLPNSPVKEEAVHSNLVLKWVLKLKPDADEALKIAAISHDIDRAITGITEKDLKDYSKIDEFKKEHALRSAKFIGEILEKHGYPSNIIKKVKHLVENHEVGGDAEQNILMNADSMAYFEHNIPFYLKRNGLEQTKEKIKFMYNRLSNDAKKLVLKIKFEDKKIEQLVKESLKTTNVFIIHGAYGNPEENWFPWLKAELEKLSCKVFVPTFPTPEHQTLEDWMEVLKSYQKEINKDTIFIGHSLGVPFILHLLEKFKVKGTFLVAGFCTLPENQFKEGMRSFVKYFDYQKIKCNCKNFSVYHSDNDPYLPLSLGKELAEKTGVKLTLVKNAGHFNEKAGYTKFPLLLEEIKKIS
ncbi:MAG: DUF4202 family protein [Nanoarchaeota archaeon]